MSLTDYLLDLLVTRNYLSRSEADQARRWASAQREDGDLAAAFVQTGIFQNAAVRTLELMSKGFITNSDPSLLFAMRGTAGFRESVLPEFTSVSRGANPIEIASESEQPRPDKNAVEPARHDDASKKAIDHRQLVDLQPTTPISATIYPNVVASRSKPADTAEVGSTLGKCLLTGILGKGGRGTVFSALHTTLNIPVAVKVLQADDRDDQEHRQELQNEAQLLARLNHPNVVRVLDFDHTAIPYVVLEFVEGPSLAELIGQTGGLRSERAIDVILQAARGLAAAWELSIVHRDIKPANILLTRSGVVKVADLGLALDSDRPDPDAVSGVPLGTCAYMAPEQARGTGKADFRSDIYSLGATLYHAVTGQLPFSAKNPREMLFKHATSPLVPAHEVAPGHVDPRLSNVISQMMAKEPGERFSSYKSLIEELDPVSRFDSPQAQSDTKSPQVENTARPSTIMGWLFRKSGG
ncbi:MAG: hypothetical protein C0467_05920 [Planctomycetaceae bacterium]|nr:hypothetical protein [Planctomycetaceae bacterium]